MKEIDIKIRGYLKQRLAEGVEKISVKDIAEATGVNKYIVRKFVRFVIDYYGEPDSQENPNPVMGKMEVVLDEG